MKLRITSSSIRLRLSQTDVGNFAENGSIEETLAFGSGDAHRLTYRLERDADASSVRASYVNNTLTVSVPVALAESWTSTELVGFDNEGMSEVVKILVEKDFKCLTPRAGDEDRDTFPHPRASENC